MKSQIRFDHDKRGRKVAYRWNRRWFRMPLTEAELLEQTGQAIAVYYGPNPFQPGDFTFTTIHQIGDMEVIKIERVS